MTRTLAAILFGGLGLLAAGPAAACSCMAPEGTVMDVLRSGAVVVLGVPTAVLEDETDSERAAFVIAYRVEVSKALNDRVPPVITVTTARDGAMCGAPLAVGRPAVLMVGRRGAESYSVDLCSQIQINSAEGDWRVLFDALPE